MFYSFVCLIFVVGFSICFIVNWLLCFQYESCMFYSMFFNFPWLRCNKSVVIVGAVVFVDRISLCFYEIVGRMMGLTYKL